MSPISLPVAKRASTEASIVATSGLWVLSHNAFWHWQDSVYLDLDNVAIVGMFFDYRPQSYNIFCRYARK
jgi:hypothetical protein